MAARQMDGLSLARSIRGELAARVARLREAGIQPRLDVLVASQDPSSQAYVRMKRKWAELVGIEGQSYEVDASWTDERLSCTIERLNADPSVHGILMQHPLPPHLDEVSALERLNPDKDVDGISPQSLGRLAAGRPGFRSATPLGMMKLLDAYDVQVRGLHALVIGRSVILGKPAALMLLQRDATVTIAHSRTPNLAELCSHAHIVVAAAGRPEMVRGEWLRPGAVVLDAGYNRLPGRDRDVGDVHFESAVQRAALITPVPGGVGPMTVASLLSNLVDATEACTASAS